MDDLDRFSTTGGPVSQQSEEAVVQPDLVGRVDLLLSSEGLSRHQLGIKDHERADREHRQGGSEGDDAELDIGKTGDSDQPIKLTYQGFLRADARVQGSFKDDYLDLLARLVEHLLPLHPCRHQAVNVLLKD